MSFSYFFDINKWGDYEVITDSINNNTLLDEFKIVNDLSNEWNIIKKKKRADIPPSCSVI